MRIVFQGNQSTEDAASSLLSILKLFKERYGIDNFREMNLQMTLMDEGGEDVELIDASTSEVLSVFEVCKSSELEEKESHLKLVVDNTEEDS